MLRHWQLFAASFWGLLALGILFRSSFMNEDALARLPVRNWTVALLICGLLAVWNVARWYQVRDMRKSATLRESLRESLRGSLRESLRPQPDARRGYEYHPELDFQNMDRQPKSPGPESTP